MQEVSFIEIFKLKLRWFCSSAMRATYTGNPIISNFNTLMRETWFRNHTKE
jgi:hypothetical protein